MKVYNYIESTGELVGSNDARKNPLEEGKYLLPAHATTKQPLESKDGFAVCFVKDAWEYQEDNRNKDYVMEISPLSEILFIDYIGVLKNDEILCETLQDKEDGTYYEYYNEDGTPDMVTIRKKKGKEVYEDKEEQDYQNWLKIEKSKEDTKLRAKYQKEIGESNE